MVAIFFAVVVLPSIAPVGTATPEALAPGLSSMWLAPGPSRLARSSDLADAVDDLSAGRAAQALPVLMRAARENQVDGYAVLYLGRAQLALNSLDAARASVDRLLAMRPTGYLETAAWWLSADTAEAAEDWPGAEESLRALMKLKSLEPARVLLRFGQACLKNNQTDAAIDAFQKVYFDYPLTAQAADAADALKQLNVSLTPASAQDFTRAWDRAEALVGAGRHSDARDAFAALRDVATGNDRQRVDLRLAETEYSLKHYAAAREALRPLVAQLPEAEFFYFSTLRELGQRDEYVSRARAFVEGHPADPLAERTLDNLATHFILTGDDSKAAAVFTELVTRFPTGAHADRAAWKAGWWKYKSAEYAEAAHIFESAAETFPHNDYRPSWLFWAARARQRLGQSDQAVAGFERVIADYRNSYYGRRAARAMASLVPGYGQIVRVNRTLAVPVEPGEPPSNADVIRDLLAAGLYDAAIAEVRVAQLDTGPSPLLDATMAYALNRKGDLRAGIIRMRRAYPQFLADGGETLPDDLRRIIFPIAYWNVISRYASAQKLDPYLMAALVAQESTFEAGVKSSAGAIGLMQVMPGTGRQVARALGIRPFTTARLKEPEVNVRIGMATFADRVAQYGGIAPALASYNAGDTRVVRWLAERRDLDQDEFVDDIPFPETQNYVKRILGTAEDYRALYAGGVPREMLGAPDAPGATPPVIKTPTKPSTKPALKAAPKPRTTTKKPAAKAKAPATKRSSPTKKGRK
jgi:soluble lytic murein transglycosylase